MKTLLTPLLLLTLYACTTANKETTPQDTTTVNNDTLTTVSVQPEEPEETPSDTSKLSERWEEVSMAAESVWNSWYRVTVVTSQYEAGSDVTWYFDAEFSPKYFKMTWSAEGNEGSTEFFIYDDEVECAQEEESNTLTTWCTTTGGTQITWDEDTGERTNVELLPADHGVVCNTSLKGYLDILKRLLNEGERTETDESTYTIRIEETVNYGQEFTESTEVQIHKKLYEAIK